jgi:hypothetical protein
MGRFQFDMVCTKQVVYEWMNAPDTFTRDGLCMARSPYELLSIRRIYLQQGHWYADDNDTKNLMVSWLHKGWTTKNLFL